MPEDKPRSLEEVMQEYANVCSEYGDALVSIERLKIIAQQRELRAGELLENITKLKEGAK